MSISDTFMKIERNGFLLDEAMLKVVAKQFEDDIDRLEEEFLSMREVKMVEDKFQKIENEKAKNYFI